MNICIISNLKKSGYGESTRPYYLSKELKRHGHSILHLCQRDSGEEDGIRYMKFDFLSAATGGRLQRLSNFISLWTGFRRFQPDLFYVHQMNNMRWVLATKTIPPVPIVYDAHTSSYFEDKTFDLGKVDLNRVFNLEKAICERSDYIIAASQSTRQLLKSQYNVQDDKFFLVENATYIKPVKEPHEPNNENFICSATLPFDGFISNEWALQFLFKVAEVIYQKDKSIMFQVLGGGEKPAPPVTNVVYTGYVKDFEDTLLKSDICIAPYPDNAVCGGVRNKVCDYMVLGKAIVSTAEGMRGFMDMASETDYLEANTVEGFAESILRLKRDKELRRKLENSALAKGHNYQWDVRGRQLNAAFEQIQKQVK